MSNLFNMVKFEMKEFVKLEIRFPHKLGLNRDVVNAYFSMSLLVFNP